MKGFSSRPSLKTLSLVGILLALVAVVTFSAIHVPADAGSSPQASGLTLPRQQGSLQSGRQQQGRQQQGRQQQGSQQQGSQQQGSQQQGSQQQGSQQQGSQQQGSQQGGGVSPSASKDSAMLPPGAALPSEAQCAAKIQRSSWEPRPDNYTANHSVPTAQQIAGLSPWDSSMGMSTNADSLPKQITGKFTGTTDEILQWVACKWGINVNIIRAQAVQESSWHQNQLGDPTNDQSLCPPGTWNGSSCYQSYGVLQIKYEYNVSAWSMSRDDTAFSAEYTYGIIRACYEGWMTYLDNSNPVAGYPSYHAGDIWGCLGRWFSGSWYDQGAINYIQLVKTHLANKDWTQPNF